ncbi:hypothetical protein [Schlesneria sp.]|uniref:hypothetical protein n=1 Tax=Schlesneria sp. TaxID=2762018 RepID=UPI002F06B2AA
MLGDLPERVRPVRGEQVPTPPVTKRFVQVKTAFGSPGSMFDDPVRVEVWLCDYDYSYTPTLINGRRLRKTGEVMWVNNHDPDLEGVANAQGMIELISGEWCITAVGCPLA